MRQMTITGNDLLEQPCDGCGNPAAELAIYRESDPFPVTMLFCRPCMGDDAHDPSLEWIVGEPAEIDITPTLEHVQHALFDIAPVSTFGPQDRPATTGQSGLF